MALFFSLFITVVLSFFDRGSLFLIVVFSCLTVVLSFFGRDYLFLVVVLSFRSWFSRSDRGVFCIVVRKAGDCV